MKVKIQSAGPPMKGLRILIGAVSLLIIVFIAAAICIPKRGSMPGKTTAAKAQIAAFSAALAAFHKDCGVYPPGTNGLADLIHQPAGASNWLGPYLPGDDIPRDPWGQSYVYQYPGQHATNGYPYDLYSLGPIGENKVIANGH